MILKDWKIRASCFLCFQRWAWVSLVDRDKAWSQMVDLVDRARVSKLYDGLIAKRKGVKKGER